MIGSTVDKYEVLQKVGEGGMATVYRGRHTTLDRDVAIKVLHPHLSSSSRNRKRFAREARAIEHLRHDNILEIFDYSGIDCQDCYIVTEFVEGRTLTSLVEELGPLPSEVVSMITIELCKALGFAHEQGILHRDLKPDNVMIRDDGTVKLMDFGIARFLDESQVTLTGALVGSPAFMSPEQAAEEPLDTRSDLFSLGTVLYYLVTGELPFTGSNPSLILKKVIEGDRPHVSELAPAISPSLGDLVERLMATHPEARFPDAAAVAVAARASLAEVRLAPDDPYWRVAAFLAEPESYRERLAARVSDTLLDVGKGYIADGEPLAALRLFNRLLSLDEDNAEVLELIQTLHSEPEPKPERRLLGVGVGTLLLLVIAALGLYAMLPGTLPRPTAPTEPLPVVDTTTGPARVAPRVIVPIAPAPDPDPPTPSPARPAPRPPSVRPAPDLPTLVSPPPTTGTVRLRSRIPAEVYLEGRRIGSTRLPIELDAGSYELELRSDVIRTRTVRVEVGPGEEVAMEVMVETRPATVRIGPSASDDCTVSLDGQDLGTVGALGRRVSVANPERVGHRLAILCDGKPPFEHVWTRVVLPGDVLAP
jgi:serine/threonine-protein kinase